MLNLRLDPKEIDDFIDTSSTSTKYYIETSFISNKLFRYLLFIRKKGVDLNKFFDDEIKNLDQ